MPQIYATNQMLLQINIFPQIKEITKKQSFPEVRNLRNNRSYSRNSWPFTTRRPAQEREEETSPLLRLQDLIQKRKYGRVIFFLPLLYTLLTIFFHLVCRPIFIALSHMPSNLTYAIDIEGKKTEHIFDLQLTFQCSKQIIKVNA